MIDPNLRVRNIIFDSYKKIMYNILSIGKIVGIKDVSIKVRISL